MLGEILLFVVICIGIAYITIQYTSGKPSYQGAKQVYDLSVPSQIVLSTTDLPWNAAPCSLRFAIYVHEAPRTISKVDCIDINPTTGATAFAPSCADYSFQPCACVGTDCSRCVFSAANGFMSKLLNVGDSLEFWASGYTSQNDKPYVPALLKVKTGTDSSNYYMETVALPAIPLQRWTVVTIVKEGRRFDVYYGDVLASSTLLHRLPIPPTYGANWYAGSPNWNGKIGLFVGTNKAQSYQDISKDVEKIVNTRGVPYFLDQLDFSLTTSMSSCPFGNCNPLPAVKPLNPFVVYSSSVS